MDRQPCHISLRVWGDYACLTRPEHKAERVSYPVLTPSAARGILEAVYYEPQMFYLVHEIVILKRGRWFSFRRNEVKKVVAIDKAIKGMTDPSSFEPIHAGGGAEDGTQRGMLALADVEYLISAEIRLTDRAEPLRDTLEKYHRLFVNRASNGKCFHRPYLGCREFAADFEFVPDPSAIPVRPEIWPREDLGLMLYDVFDPRLRSRGVNVRAEPVFFAAKIQDSRLDCHLDRVELVRRQLPAGGA
jgi:CRISPR-associated protein Cas5d